MMRLVSQLLLGAACLLLIACHSADSGDSVHALNFTLNDSLTQPAALGLEILNSQPQPVLAPIAHNEWESAEVLNPSVVRFNGSFFNYYSGFNGRSWTTVLATSSDGVNWERSKVNPILSISTKGWDQNYIAANGSAVIFDRKVYYFYQGMGADGVSQIGLAIAEDGVHFRKLDSPVIRVGRRGEWDSNATADPYVLPYGGKLFMYYLGQDLLGVQRLGVAKSADGVTWHKFTGNPILDVGAADAFDGNGLGEPSVIAVPPYFLMFYTGRHSSERRDLGYALSLDGVHWKKFSSTGLFDARNLRQGWNSQVVCDSSFLRLDDGRIRVWFGGGTAPQPAHGLNGKIGMFDIRIPETEKILGFDPQFLRQPGTIRSTDVLKGSYDLENDASSVAFAWVGKNSSIDILKHQLTKRTLLSIEGSVPFASHKSFNPQIDVFTLGVLADGKEIDSRSVTADGKIRIEIPAHRLLDWFTLHNSDVLTLGLNTNSSFVPNVIGISPDSRELSFQLYGIRFE